MSKVCSSHNLSKLDDILCDIEKYLYAIVLLDNVSDDEKASDLSHWSGLLHDMICLLDQSISDLRTLDACIRQEEDFDL